MKKIILILLSGWLCNAFSPAVTMQGAIKPAMSDTLRVATYNVRIRTSADTGLCSWASRKPHVGSLIRNYGFDLVGVQELVDKRQERELRKELDEFGCFSRGRDDAAGNEGERLALFYRKARFRLLDRGFFFLSPTPDVPGKGWDAALNRICLWAKFFDRHTLRTFYYFNVHLDHVGAKARSEGVKLVLRKMREIAGTGAVILGGDFNASPSDSEVYHAAVSGLSDSRLVSGQAPMGPAGTFNGWDVSAVPFQEKNRIDYLFCWNVEIISYAVLNDKYRSVAYPSDHFPVFIRCIIR